MKLRLSLIIFSLLLTAPAFAQSTPERFDRQLELIRQQTRLAANPDISAGQRMLFDYGGSLSLNYLSVDDANHDNHGLRQFDALGYAQLSFDGAHEFFVRGRASYRDFNPGDSFDGRGDRWVLRLEQAYYKFDLRRALAAYRGVDTSDDLSVTLGRQYINWANGLAFSEYLDGAAVDARLGMANLELIAGQTPTFVVDFDSSRPDFDRHTSRFFMGAWFWLTAGEHRPFVYLLHQRDNNPDTILNLDNIKTRFRYDSNYLGFGSSGPLTDRLLYSFEGTYEFGKTLSNSFAPAPNGIAQAPQHYDRISAYAADLKLDYVFADPSRTRLGFETIVASGDTDRLNSTNTLGGNLSGTTDHTFNGFGLLNTGLAFSPSVSNLLTFRLSASTLPAPASTTFKQFQVGSDLFLFYKLNSHAPIDEDTRHGKYLGFEPDVYVNWTITSDLTFSARYGLFFPGRAISTGSASRQFLYTSLTLAF